jgi:hypothetical protein
MGNVSYVVPSIHPGYAVESESGNHSPGFTAAAGSEEAHGRMIAASKALALTALDLFSDEAMLAEARREFEERAAANGDA